MAAKKTTTPVADEHAGHDHAGHDHAGHDHSHDEKPAFIGENTKLSLTLAWDAIQAEYKKVLTAQKSRLNLKGFRKGKAPESLVEETVGKDALLEQAVNRLLPAAYQEAVKKADIKPLVTPQITATSTEENKEWTFEAATAVIPEFSIKGYEGIIKDAATEYNKSEEAKKETKEEEKESNLLQAIYKALVTKIEVKLAPVLLQEELNRQFNQFQAQLERMHMTLEQYLTQSKRTQDDLENELMGVAVGALQLEFILHKIGEDQKIVLKQEDYKEILPKGDIDSLPSELRIQLEAAIMRKKITTALLSFTK